MADNKSSVDTWRRAGTLRDRLREVSGTILAMVHAGPKAQESRQSAHQAVKTLNDLLDKTSEDVVPREYGHAPILDEVHWMLVVLAKEKEAVPDEEGFFNYWNAVVEAIGVEADRLDSLRASLETLPEVKAASPPPPADTKADRPEWNRGRGQLLFRGNVVKRARVGIAKNVVMVLDSFQELDWQERVDDPLPEGRNQQRLHETIKSLNRGLNGLRFHADGKGQGFVWEPAEGH
jgi:hypothetical protein